MGLAIAKGIIEAHGGKIRAQNRQGGRSGDHVFSLPMPVEHAINARNEYSDHTCCRRRTAVAARHESHADRSWLFRHGSKDGRRGAARCCGMTRPI